jgi:hypothetical protein
MDYRHSVEGERDGLEGLFSKIPGYRGYKQKENRRAADKLLREHIVGQLDEQRRRLVELQRDMLEGGGLLMLDDMERAVTKVQKLADKIRTASYGYAGLFDAVKIEEQDLDALYVFDEDMLSQVSNIQAAIDALAAAVQTEGGDAQGALRQVVSATGEAETTWRKRVETITGPATSI